MSISIVDISNQGVKYDAAVEIAIQANFDALAGEAGGLTVTGADLASSGTGTITIQLVDKEGTALAGNALVRTWIGTADDFSAVAQTDYSVDTGTAKEAVTADAEYLVVSDDTGLIVMAVDAGGADSVWAWASLADIIYSSGEVVLTAGE